MTGSKVVCFGVSHHRASVGVRERIRFALFDGRELLLSNRTENGNGHGNGNGFAKSVSMIQEMVLLSTCNRVELYACIDENASKSAQRLLYDLVVEASLEARRRTGVPEQEWSLTREMVDEVTYYYSGNDAIQHICRVACGLESMVLGETQILTQINEAYENARDAGLAGPVLSAVFRAAHRVGKEARHSTDISSNPSSVSSAAISLAKTAVSDLDTKDITVVGLGEMAQLALKSLYTRGARRLRVVNRTIERAAALAQHVTQHTTAAMAVHGIDELPEVLALTDVIITATGSEDWIIGAEMVKTAVEKREGRELVLIDIAVPRNIEPTAGGIDGVRLFDTGDIEAVKESGIAARRREIPKVEAIIAEEIKQLEVSLRKVELKPLISELRRKAETIRQSELERAYRKLGSPDPETWTQVQRLTESLVNKLYHHPTSIMKEKATLGKADSYAATVRELFGLNDASEDSSDDE